MYGMMGCQRASVSQVSLGLFIRGSISPWRWSLWLLDYQEASNTQWSSCLRPLRAWIQILARIPDLFHGCWDPDSSPLFHSSHFRIAKPPPLPQYLYFWVARGSFLRYSAENIPMAQEKPVLCIGCPPALLLVFWLWTYATDTSLTMLYLCIYNSDKHSGPMWFSLCTDDMLKKHYPVTQK